MLFHRRENAEIALKPNGVVVTDIILNHIYKAFSVREFVPVVPFALENAPKTFHWAVVNAVGHSGHALSHAGFLYLRMKCSVGILKSSVTMEDWMGIRVRRYGSVKCIVYQRNVIAVSNHIGNNASVIEIKNGAEINLVLFAVLIPLELRDVC